MQVTPPDPSATRLRTTDRKLAKYLGWRNEGASEGLYGQSQGDYRFARFLETCLAFLKLQPPQMIRQVDSPQLRGEIL